MNAQRCRWVAAGRTVSFTVISPYYQSRGVRTTPEACCFYLIASDFVEEMLKLLGRELLPYFSLEK